MSRWAKSRLISLTRTSPGGYDYGTCVVCDVVQGFGLTTKDSQLATLTAIILADHRRTLDSSLTTAILCATHATQTGPAQIKMNTAILRSPN